MVGVLICKYNRNHSVWVGGGGGVAKPHGSNGEGGWRGSEKRAEKVVRKHFNANLISAAAPKLAQSLH